MEICVLFFKKIHRKKKKMMTKTKKNNLQLIWVWSISHRVWRILNSTFDPIYSELGCFNWCGTFYRFPSRPREIKTYIHVWVIACARVTSFWIDKQWYGSGPYCFNWFGFCITVDVISSLFIGQFVLMQKSHI